MKEVIGYMGSLGVYCYIILGSPDAQWADNGSVSRSSTIPLSLARTPTCKGRFSFNCAIVLYRLIIIIFLLALKWCASSH